MNERILFFKRTLKAAKPSPSKTPPLMKAQSAASRIVVPPAPRVVSAAEKGALPPWHGAFDKLVEAIRTGRIPKK